MPACLLLCLPERVLPDGWFARAPFTLSAAISCITLRTNGTVPELTRRHQCPLHVQAEKAVVFNCVQGLLGEDGNLQVQSSVQSIRYLVLALSLQRTHPI
jgi:D-alanine-D-alanine ligase-like ATP-grasp enzyme